LITFGLARMGMTGTVLLIPIALLAGALLYWQLGHLERTEEGRAAVERASIDRRTVVSLVLIVLAVMCLAWFQWSFRSYLPTWLQEQGQTLVFASQVMFIFAIALGVGTLLGGILSDRLGRWQLLAISLALLGPALWVFLSAPASLHVPLVVVLGVLVGATFPISIVMAQETWPSGVGVASGLVMGLGWVPGGIGASLTGMLADRTSLTSAMYTLVVPALLSTVCVLAYAVVQRLRPVPEPLSVAERP
jgi:FSR family fosmidomycin resistance protein-like MFS transporter